VKKKTIKRYIGNKFNSYVKSIKDKEVRKMVKENTIITGGCITSMLLNEDVNDFDLYFRNLETAKTVAKYYTKLYLKNNPLTNMPKETRPERIEVTDDSGRIRIKVLSSGIASENAKKETYKYFEGVTPIDGGEAQEKFLDERIPTDPNIPTPEGICIDYMMSELKQAEKPKTNNTVYRPVFLTSNAITLSEQIQLIIRFYGEPEEIHKNYDFIHCTNYWTSWNQELVLHANALESILTKELIYSGSLYPICSVLRLRKFIDRGWTVNAGQILKMCMQISDLNLNDPSILEEQLIGVDVAYFSQLIAMIRHSNKPEEINTAYIADLIDRIF